MKKITSLILALVMALSLTTAAFAATTNGTVTITTDSTTSAPDSTLAFGDTYTINVPGSFNKVNPDGNETANYYVVVEWTVDSTLIYKAGGQGYTWTLKGTDNFSGEAVTKNVKSAGYVSNGGAWSGDASVTLTVKNWSNKALTATSEFTGADESLDYVDTTITATATGKGSEWTVGAEKTSTIASAAANILANIDQENAQLYTSDPVTATQTITLTNVAGALNASGNIGFVTLTINKA